MDSASRIAARYCEDAKLRRLCQTVVPVAGLLAQAAATLREAEFRSFGQIAHLPQDDRDLLLLSSDHFLSDDPTLTVMPVERAELLDRFGLFGVRQAIDLVVRGEARTSAELAFTLTELSGIGALRAELLTRFGERAAVLKARSALNALEAGIGEHDPLAAAVERIRAGAHELVELRLLNQVRTGDLALSPADIDDVERLVGGGAPAVRLGLGAEADPSDVRSALFAALDRWQRKMESPVSGQAVKDAARAVVRTCEGMLADLPVGPDTSS
jgi:hypothetical protein